LLKILKNDVYFFIILFLFFTFKNIFIWKTLPLIPLTGLIIIFIMGFILKNEIINFVKSLNKLHHVIILITIIILCINFYISQYKIFFIKSVVKYFTFILLTLIFVIIKKQNYKNFIISWFIIIELFGICENFFYKQLKPILFYIDQFGVREYPKITSIFIHHNIFGVFCAIVGAYSLINLFSIKNNHIKILSIIAIITSIYGIILSTSKNALLSFLIATIIYSLLRGDINTKIILLIIFIFLLGGIYFTCKNSRIVAYRLGKALPAPIKIYKNQKLKIKDFYPKFKSGLNGRERFWQIGLNLFKKSPYFGIGIGQFRLKNKINKRYNLHNLYVQMLVEGGIFLFLIFIFYIIYFLIKFYPSIYYSIYIAILVSICFDNFFDYSFLWNIFASWIFSEIIFNINQKNVSTRSYSN